MKIQCDVCSSSEASVFCSADEAALCDSCDHRVHHANKLASKHQRFCLVNPDRKDTPVCDICQEKRAFLFCQQDRAILCKDCDFSIHSANEYTKKHNRFLLTGVKLRTYVSSTTSSLTSSCDLVPDFKSQPLTNKSDSVSNESLNQQSLAAERIASPSSSSGVGKSGALRNDVGISEYLIEMLPGWHVEDFLDPTSAPNSFSMGIESMLPFNNTDFQTSNFSTFPLQNAAIWVPQASQPPKQAPHLGAAHLTANITFKEPTNGKANKQRTDEGFTVPQLSPQFTTTSCKRSRPLWYW